MAPSRSDTSASRFVTKNKEKRRAFQLKQKKLRETEKRDLKLRRKREEDKNPALREVRRSRNIPVTIDNKRVWDIVDIENGDGIGLSVDLERFKRRKVGHGESNEDDAGLTENNLQQLEKQVKDAIGQPDANAEVASDASSADDDLGSLMEDSQEDDGGDASAKLDNASEMPPPPVPDRIPSPPASTTSTNLSLIPDALAAKFPTLFTPLETPKILITTSLNSTLHSQAELLTRLFPNSNYVPRSRHRYNAHNFSLREISKFAANREYTSLLVLSEDQKRPSGLTVVHLPSGPTFHFSISNWVEGRKLPGHGNPTGHDPELILNNFRTPLGLLTAHLFRTMFPPQPEIQGRQVVTLHNQRDYIFLRRHRYIFRDKRATEKSVIGTDGKPVKGVEDIKAGLQELGPRFTLKLRRVDKGIQRASGQEWEWKAGMEKQRTKFQL